MSVEHNGLTSHAASGGKNQWGENSMFNISNAVTIFTLLCILMTFIGRVKAKGAVAGSIWVKHPNIKICVLAPTPEASGFNIKTSIVSGVSRRKRKCLGSNRLQRWFCLNIMRNFCEQRSS